MLQKELHEACQEYRQEIEAEMRRMVREADKGTLFDLDRHNTLSNEALLLVALQACAASIGETHDGPKAEAHHAN